MLPIDIVLLVYNRLNYLQQTIQALIQYTEYPYRLIVIDNNSTDNKVKKYLKKLQKNNIIYKLIFNKANFVLKGWQSGLLEVNSRLFAISDPDITVPKLSPCWLTQLVSLIEKFPRLARIGLSLDPKDVPPCWSKREAKRLAFKKGPYFNKEYGLRIIDIDTTMQIIRTASFKRAGGLKEELNISFWKKFHKYGFSVASQNIIAKHLGWNEYKEEPEYLYEKCKRIREYPEKDLIKRQPAQFY